MEYDTLKKGLILSSVVHRALARAMLVGLVGIALIGTARADDLLKRDHAQMASGAVQPASEQVDTALLCAANTDRIETATHLPARLLRTISEVESGRYSPAHHAVLAWPWSINAAGVPHVYNSKQEAIAGVVALQAAGIRSIDVGCMQVNLLQHPAAFASLDQAFDPETNIRYAGAFLKSLYGEMKNWQAAAAAYHSRTALIGAEYGQRVMQRWPLAVRYASVATDMIAALPEPPQPQPPQVDPLNIYTPEFRARLAEDIAMRHARDVAMRSPPDEVAEQPDTAGTARKRY